MVSSFGAAGRTVPNPQPVYQAVTRIYGFLDTWLWPLVQLALRILLFRVFFWSGLTKIADFDQTVLLFEWEYQVPLLPADIAAVLATAVELVR